MDQTIEPTTNVLATFNLKQDTVVTLTMGIKPIIQTTLVPIANGNNHSN